MLIHIVPTKMPTTGLGVRLIGSGALPFRQVGILDFTDSHEDQRVGEVRTTCHWTATIEENIEDLGRASKSGSALPLPTPDDAHRYLVVPEFANRKNIHCAPMADLEADRLANPIDLGRFSRFPKGAPNGRER